MLIKYEPFSRQQRVIDVADEKVVLPPFALLAWASLTQLGLNACPTDCLRFPVVLDPGFSHNLLIQEASAVTWAGLSIQRTNTLPDPWVGMVADSAKQSLTRELPVQMEDASGRVVVLPAFAACLWLHPNKPGKTPRQLLLSRGFTFYPTPVMPTDPIGPRVPLLGALVLHVGQLKLMVDYKNFTYSLAEQY